MDVEEERTKTNRNLCYGTTHFAILATQFLALTIHWDANGRKRKVPMFVFVWGWGASGLAYVLCSRAACVRAEEKRIKFELFWSQIQTDKNNQ